LKYYCNTIDRTIATMQNANNKRSFQCEQQQQRHQRQRHSEAVEREVICISDDEELPPILPDNYYQVARISDVEFICIDFETIDEVKMTLEHVVQSVEIEDQLRRDTEDVKRTLNCIIETVITNEEIAFKQINETHVRSEVQEVVVGLVGTVALTPVAAVLLADESDSTDSDNEN
jgi:hypothetical protein